MAEQIKIQYKDDTIERLKYIDGKSDWIDLRAAERIELKQGEFKLIPLGVAMQLPEGYEAHIVPRSSTYKNFGIIQTNHTGIVETDIRRIPSDEVAGLFESCDYFVMPYQSIAQSGAMTVAMNYNLPVIASDLDTFHEFIEDNETGWFFNAGNTDDLAALMEKLINIPEKEYLRIKSNQSEFVRMNLSIDGIVNKYSNYFNKCLN